MVRAYLDFIRIRFLMMLAYRMNYYTGIIIYVVNIGANYFLWKAIYQNQISMGDFNLSQMTTYVAVSWMARAFYFNNLDREIAEEIKDGSVAIQFIRPYTYLIVKMMQGLGEGIFRLFLFSLPGMLIVFLLFPIHLPHSLFVWMIFLTMLFFSFLINSQINLLTGLAAFFIENNEGVMRMKRVAVDLLSGLIIPISFFPSWAVKIFNFLPFQTIAFLPGSVITGRVHQTNAILRMLGLQVFWFAFLIVPLYFLWRSARRRLFIQGG